MAASTDSGDPSASPAGADTRHRYADPRLRLDRRLNRPALPYLGVVDGLRGVAILALVLGHAGVRQLGGGDTALSTFFATIGFVLATVLVAEDERTPHEIDIDLFWWERLRRLVPGLLAAVALATIVVAVGTSLQRAGFRGAALSVLGQAGNWWFLREGVAPAATWVALPTSSPVWHLWSLSVLSQLLVVLPVIVSFTVQVSIRRRYAVAGVFAGIAVVSTAAAAVIGPRPGAYFGTWVHAAAFFLGGVLAYVVYDRRVTTALAHDADVRFWLGIAGPVAIGALVASWVLAQPDQTWLWHGGWAALGLLTCVALAAALVPGSLLHRLLRLMPLCFLGRHAYGLFLFHWPVFVLVTPERTHLGFWPALGVQLAVLLVSTLASWVLFERRVLEGKHFLGVPTIAMVAFSAIAVVAGVLVVTSG